MKKTQKWGFGMAPLKKETQKKNRQAIILVMNLIKYSETPKATQIVDSISWVKGLFNRIVKQDQWDWFTVNVYFDYPTNKDIHKIVSNLSFLRKAILNDNKVLQKEFINNLSNCNFIKYCNNYLNYSPDDKTQTEYLYILSRREEPNLLKIGMTTRNVIKRVNEINSATGVLYPYSARKVYKVKNSAQVEKDIHELLQEYRIRSDREFFLIEYKEACSIIESYLYNHKRYYYE